jgi:hypothetical protein
MRRLILLALLLPSLALAALPARVDEDGTPFYSVPSAEGQVLKTLQKGTALAVSNYPTEGFYKARTVEGDVGWVSADVLILYEREQAGSKDAPTITADGRPVDPRRAPPSVSSPPTEPHWVLRAFAGLDFYNMTAVNTQLGDNYLTSAVHFGGEGHYLLQESLALVLRGEYLTSTVTASTATLNSFELFASSIPIMGGVNIGIFSNEHFSFGAGILVGLGFETQLTSTALNQEKPNKTVYGGTALAGLVRAELVWKITRLFSLFAESGYRYLKTAQAKPLVEGNGSGLFTSTTTGTILPLPVDFSGWVMSLGAGITF